MDDKQKTNEEVKASSFDSEKSSKNQAFENTEEPAEGFRTFNMIMDLILRKNKTVRLKRQARTKPT